MHEHTHNTAHTHTFRLACQSSLLNDNSAHVFVEGVREDEVDRHRRLVVVHDTVDVTALAVLATVHSAVECGAWCI